MGCGREGEAAIGEAARRVGAGWRALLLTLTLTLALTHPDPTLSLSLSLSLSLTLTLTLTLSLSLSLTLTRWLAAFAVAAVESAPPGWEVPGDLRGFVRDLAPQLQYGLLFGGAYGLHVTLLRRVPVCLY